MKNIYQNSAQTKEMAQVNDFLEDEILDLNQKADISIGKIADIAETESVQTSYLSGQGLTQNVKQNKKELNNTDKRSNKSEKQPQTSDENAEFARHRRERETKEKIEQAKVDAVIEALDGINPLTNESIQTKEDVQKYLALKKSLQNKNNSNNLNAFEKLDYNSIKNANIQQNQKNIGEIIENINEINSIYKNNGLNTSQNDALEFAENQKREYLLNHSEDEYVSLMQDEDFINYSSDKSQISLEMKQKEYQNFVKKIEHNARLLASQILANKLSSPGALRTDVSVEPSYLSREQVEGMSSKEIHDNYDKIKQSMKHW